jgi:small subunit ribosomal protein S2
MKDLLEAGVHFGHKSASWNPHMKKYIFMKRKGVHIIDLQKTLRLVEEAYRYVKNVVANGGSVLFVGTKKQAKACVKEHAARCGQYSIAKRWIGGLLTNFDTVKKSCNKLIELTKLLEDPNESSAYSKKELILFTKKRDKLENTFGGVKTMKKLPQLLFVVDAGVEEIAILEAKKMHIPIVSLVDTNSNPENIDVVIPGNDDAIRAINLFVSYIAEAVIEGKEMRPDMDEKSSDKVAEIPTAEAPSTSPAAVAETTAVKPEEVSKKEEEPKVEVVVEDNKVAPEQATVVAEETKVEPEAEKAETTTTPTE